MLLSIANDRVLSNILGKACLSPLGRHSATTPAWVCRGAVSRWLYSGSNGSHGELTDSKAEPVRPSMKELKEKNGSLGAFLWLRTPLTRDHL